MCLGLVWWFASQRAKNGQAISSGGNLGLYLVLVGGTLATLPIATQPLSELLNF